MLGPVITQLFTFLALHPIVEVDPLATRSGFASMSAFGECTVTGGKWKSRPPQFMP